MLEPITRKPRMLLDHIRRHPGSGYEGIRQNLGWGPVEIHAALCRLRGHDLVTPCGTVAAILPEQIDRTKLSACTRAVLRYLDAHRGQWMRISNIARRTGFATWSVSRALERLRGVGVHIYYGRDLWPVADRNTWQVHDLHFKPPVLALVAQSRRTA